MELVEWLRGAAQVLPGSCLPYGDGITFWPIAEVVRQAAAVDAGDPHDVARSKLAQLMRREESGAVICAQLDPALGLSDRVVSIEEIFWSVRTFLGVLAGRRPLLVVLDDLHWAEEALLDLVDYLAAQTGGVPFLLVCVTRPDLLERRGAIGGRRANAAALVLEPLGSYVAGELMRRQLSGGDLPRELAQRDPRDRRRQSALHPGTRPDARRRGRCRASGWGLEDDDRRSRARDAGDDPGVARRSPRSARGRRSRCGAASGRGWPGLLASRRQRALRRVGPPDPRTRAGEPRAQAVHRPESGHARSRGMRSASATSSCATRPTRARSRACGPSSTSGTRDGRRAQAAEAPWSTMRSSATTSSRLLPTGANWATSSGPSAPPRRRRHDSPRRGASARVGRRPRRRQSSGRAADILTPDHPQRLGIRLEAIPALVESGRIEQADAGLDEILACAGEKLEAAGRRVHLAATAWRAFVDFALSRETWLHGEPAIQAWLTACREDDDSAGLAVALDMLARAAASIPGRTGRGRSAVVERSRSCRPRRGSASGSRGSVLAPRLAVGGPLPVGLALERCDAVANRPGASRKVQAFVAMQRGVLEAMQGQFARGRESVAQARQELEELGQSLYAIGSANEAAAVETMARDPQAAEAILRPALGRFEEIGEQAYYSTHAGILAHLLCDQGRFGEAAAFVTRCRETAPADDLFSQELWRGALARIAAREGDDSTALQLAEDALALLASTDWLVDHAGTVRRPRRGARTGRSRSGGRRRARPGRRPVPAQGECGRARI